MISKNKKPSAFKPARDAFQLSPSYLYEIGLISQTPSWLSQDGIRKNIATTQKRINGR